MIAGFDPADLDYNDLIELVRSMRSTLWPEGNLDHEWSPDTLDQIAGILTDAGLRPMEK
jgi:hypothetical protein